MQACAWSVLVQTIMVVAIPLVMGGEPKVGEDGTPEVKNDGRRRNPKGPPCIQA